MATYLDSTFLLYGVLDAGPKGEWCRGRLAALDNGCTSALTCDEVHYKLLRLKDRETANDWLARLLAAPEIRLLPADATVLQRALRLLERTELLPRDAIHAATALLAGAKVVLSEDSDFDRVEGLRREWAPDE